MRFDAISRQLLDGVANGFVTLDDVAPFLRPEPAPPGFPVAPQRQTQASSIRPLDLGLEIEPVRRRPVADLLRDWDLEAATARSLPSQQSNAAEYPSDLDRVRLALFDPWDEPSAILAHEEGSPGDPRLQLAIRKYMREYFNPKPITGDVLRQIMPNAGINAEKYAPYLESAMTHNMILTPSQRAAFLSQVSVETGDLKWLREVTYYRDAQGAANTFHRVFRGNPEAARPYLRNEIGFANRVYAGLNGNGSEASGDGYRYRGGGFFHLTGRENYRKFGYENNPERLGSPDAAAETAVAYWLHKGLNQRSFNEIISKDVYSGLITRPINQALKAADRRWEAYQRGLRALSR